MTARLGISWSMAARLRDVVIGRTHQRSMPLAMLTMKKIKSCMGFNFYVCMWFCSYKYGAPLAALAPLAPLNFIICFQ